MQDERASLNAEVFGIEVRRASLPPPSAGNLPSVQKLRARNTRLPLAQAPQEAVSRGVIRLSTPIWHERGLTRPRRETLLVHLGTKAGMRSWSTNSLVATGGRHETCAEACNSPWPQRYSYLLFLPLCGRCPDESSDRSRYGDAPKHGSGHIGSVDDSMPSWLGGW